jgi:hypothetical protein
VTNTTIAPSVGSQALTPIAAGNNPSSAFFYLSEFRSLFDKPLSGSTFPRPATTDQTVAYGTFAGLSAPFSVDTRIVRLLATAVCSVKIGAQPVAVTNPQGSTRMLAGQCEYFATEPGNLLSVIVSS